MKYGTHLSISKGFTAPLHGAVSLRYNSVQIFTASPQRVCFDYDKVKDIHEEFKEFKDSFHLSVVSHGSLISNFASDKAKTRELSVNSLVSEMKRCAILDIPYIVIHPGSNMDREEGLSNIVQALDTAFDKLHFFGKQYNGMVLIETMAQSGGQLCVSPKEFEYIFSNLKYPERFGICFDTAHVFATDINIEDFLEGLELFSLKDKIKVVHFNDSKFPIHSHKDRHADFGTGEIPSDTLQKVLTDLKEAIFITEPPTPEGRDGVKLCLEQMHTL